MYKPDGIFDKSVYVPLCLTASYFVLIAQTVSKTSILIFDSLGWEHSRGAQCLVRYLEREARHRGLLGSEAKCFDVDVHHVPVSIQIRLIL